MTDISELLSETAHRPFELPVGKWKYYQEWNHALFLHWAIPIYALRNYVPRGLDLDTFKGEAYVSLVAFTMQRIRPKNLPAIRFISEFEEINLRTYIETDRKKGVYFLSIEASKAFSVLIAKTLSGLRYEKAIIHRAKNKITSANKKSGYYLDTEFAVGQELKDKTELDKWLMERYCLYFDKEDEVFRYDIHHREWKIRQVKITRLNLKYNIGQLNLDMNTKLIHFSDGVEVIAWGKQSVK